MDKKARLTVSDKRTVRCADITYYTQSDRASARPPPRTVIAVKKVGVSRKGNEMGDGILWLPGKLCEFREAVTA